MNRVFFLIKTGAFDRAKVASSLFSLLLLFLLLPYSGKSQLNPNKFQPMEWEWPTPDNCRTASGAPGPEYWQQQVDYVIHVSIDDNQQKLSGRENITYKNNSPHTLSYIWVQLDQETYRKGSTHFMMDPSNSKMQETWADAKINNREADHGCNILSVKDGKGSLLTYSIIETNLRITLPSPLLPKTSFSFSIEWNHRINNAKVEGRCGYEYFEKDKNYIYEMAQWYPRLCLYDNAKGWETQPYFGGAEFGLEFGNFEVHITVPADHIVASTGILQNETSVLNAEQLKRFTLTKNTFDIPSFIITPAEAKANESSRSDEIKTWIFKAENVRDFSFASSRKFVWDAASVKVGDKNILAQSFYPNEAVPLWDKYSTHAIMHTLKTYSKYTLDYPYPTAIAVNGPVWGMEYPMICFCGGRPDESGNYSDWIKRAMISVVIHEVGHNFFPMLINNDERRWAWMDEGFNSFFQYLTEQEWQENYPSHRGPAKDIAYFMTGSSVNPIMTNAESITSNGNTSYGKTAAGLWMLREFILGREEFKFAFNEYARRWAFRHPEPADFFRTVRDASGKNLDWFWREWFYSTDIVNLSLTSTEMEVLPEGGSYTPSFSWAKEKFDTYYVLENGLEEKETLIPVQKKYSFSNPENEFPSAPAYSNTVTVRNKGECPMPIPLTIIYHDDSIEHFIFPVESWIRNNDEFTATIITRKPAKGIILDYFELLPDTDRDNHDLELRISIEAKPEEGENNGKKKKN